MTRTRIVVLASGQGSNLQAILDACTSGVLSAEVIAVVSDRPEAHALTRAASAGVPGVHVVRREAEPREVYDARLADIVSAFSPDVVVLAGWMRILTMAFLGWFPGMVINLHPALPGELPGVGAIERALDEARAGRREVTGVTVHLVPDAGVDTGPTLASAVVPILADDTVESLSGRMHAVEHRLLVDTLIHLCRERVAA